MKTLYRVLWVGIIAGTVAGLCSGVLSVVFNNKFVAADLGFLSFLQFREAFNSIAIPLILIGFGLSFLVGGERRGRLSRLRVSTAVVIGLVAIAWLVLATRSGGGQSSLNVEGNALSISLPLTALASVALSVIIVVIMALLLRRGRQIVWPKGRIALLLACLALLGVNLAAVVADLTLTRAASRKPNVVLISIDTLRPDHLGCYGYKRDTSPTIDSLAAEAVRFETVVVPMSHTLPTHVSLLTGLHPLSHGVTMNGMDLEAGILTLTEVFKNMGFSTAAFVGSVILDGERGLARGFDLYDDAMEQERTAEEVRRSATEWLERSAGDSFFMFVHFWDPHAPYAPPDSFTERFEDPPRELGEIFFNTSYDHAHLRNLDPDFDHAQLPQIVQREIDGYDSEIRYLDRELGKLFETLERLGHWDDTLVVLTSDHGEGLGERGWWGHELFYEEHIRVPLIVKLPGNRGAPGTVRAPAGTLDIMPTVLHVLGVSPPRSLPGRSLLDAMESDAGSAERTFLLERRDYPWGMRLLHPELWGRGKEYAARTNGWKLILRLNGEDSLYNLVDDPLESQNLIGQQIDIGAHLRLVLYDWLAASGQGEAVADVTSQMDDETIENLKSLGYIQ